MISHIKVCCRQWVDGLVKGDDPSRFYEFCNISKNQRWHLISIYSEQGVTKNNFDEKELMIKSTVELFQNLGMVSYLSLKFLDITDKDIDLINHYGKEAVLFDGYMALKIRMLLLELSIDKSNNDVLVVHCQAGVSRSGAVGLYANDYFQLNYFDFKELNPTVMPNPYVSHILNKVGRIMDGIQV